MLFASRVLGFHAWALLAAAIFAGHDVEFSDHDEQAGEFVSSEDELGSTPRGVGLRLFL